MGYFGVPPPPPHNKKLNTKAPNFLGGKTTEGKNKQNARRFPPFLTETPKKGKAHCLSKKKPRGAEVLFFFFFPPTTSKHAQKRPDFSPREKKVKNLTWAYKPRGKKNQGKKKKKNKCPKRFLNYPILKV